MMEELVQQFLNLSQKNYADPEVDVQGKCGTKRTKETD
jgi:hypothetical protein